MLRGAAHGPTHRRAIDDDAAPPHVVHGERSVGPQEQLRLQARHLGGGALLAEVHVNVALGVAGAAHGRRGPADEVAPRAAAQARERACVNARCRF